MVIELGSLTADRFGDGSGSRAACRPWPRRGTQVRVGVAGQLRRPADGLWCDYLPPVPGLGVLSGRGGGRAGLVVANLREGRLSVAAEGSDWCAGGPTKLAMADGARRGLVLVRVRGYGCAHRRARGGLVKISGATVGCFGIRRSGARWPWG